MLTAKEAALRHGYAPLDVHISRTNLVVANAVNLGEERLRSLIDRLGPRLGSVELQERLFKTVWENLQYVGELGSLVQVREGVTRVLDDWVEQQAKQQGLTRLVLDAARASSNSARFAATPYGSRPTSWNCNGGFLKRRPPSCAGAPHRRRSSRRRDWQLTRTSASSPRTLPEGSSCSRCCRVATTSW